MLRERNERRLPERSDDEDDAEHRVQEHVDKTHGDEHGGGADPREVVATQVEDVEEGGESGEKSKPRMSGGWRPPPRSRRPCE